MRSTTPTIPNTIVPRSPSALEADAATTTTSTAATHAPIA